MSDQGSISANSSENEASSSNPDSSDAVQVPVESLVSGRARRVTAGNRLSNLLEREVDDELELLFAENDEEEDVEFEGDDAEVASDVQLDTSSDEEDQGTTNAEDELEGEKELQKQNWLEVQRKRNAQKFLKRRLGIQKRIRSDQTTQAIRASTPTSRPKKKSERVSWIPTPEEGPTRSSTRKQTVQNKKIVHLRMAENEKRRVQLIRSMEAAAKRKEASKPRAKTQAQRMEEAARVERKNAKSLYRWEEAEKKRSEEQKAKLEALHSRQLSGPVITWWSGIAKWKEGKLQNVGIQAIREAEQDDPPIDEPENPDTGTNNRRESVTPSNQNAPIPADSTLQGVAADSFELQASDLHTNQDHSQAYQVAPQAPRGLLDGIHYYASLPLDTQRTSASGPNYSKEQKNGPANHLSKAPSSIPHSAPDALDARPQKSTNSRIEYSSRNLVALKNIDANAMRTPELQTHVLLKKRNGRLHSSCSY